MIETLFAINTLLLVANAGLLVLNGRRLRVVREMLAKTVPPGNRTITEPLPLPRRQPIHTFKKGDRVRILPHAGFCPNFQGVVDYQEPNGNKCWVIRDNAGSALWWWNHELAPEGE